MMLRKSFEPVSASTSKGSNILPTFVGEEPVSEPQWIYALTKQGLDQCENFYFKAIKYHEKPSSKPEIDKEAAI
jgi:hypothetical protein